MPRLKKKKKTPAKRSEDACLFCNSEEDNEETYGKLLKKQDITIHYFCMLFSSGLWQRGKRDRDGILGFMPADIFREHKRGNRLTCQYCRKKGATIGCVISNCRKTFHFRCGREAGGLSQFFQEFRSYCPDHRPCQETHTSDRLAFYGTAKSTCSICMLSVEARASNDTLRSPCCRKAWFHRNCIQRYAQSAGAYFFKCPLCNNKELFEAEMLEFGIYIPEQDAAWEQDPRAYQELLERYSRCDARDCQCPQGREHEGASGSRWEITLCDWCGSSGTHIGCHGFSKIGKDKLCQECAEISIDVERNKLAKKKGYRSPISRQPNLNQQEVHRQLEQQRLASLRAQRAARRHSMSTSPDIQKPTISPRTGLNITPQENNLGANAVPATRTRKSKHSTAITSPKLLKDHRLIGSTPVVYVERAESETEEINVTDAEEPSEANSGRKVNHSSAVCQVSSQAGFMTSEYLPAAEVKETSSEVSCMSAQDWPQEEITHSSLEKTKVTESSPCQQDFLQAQEKKGQSESSFTVPEDLLHLEGKTVFPECEEVVQALSTFTPAQDLSHAEVMGWDLSCIKEKKKAVLLSASGSPLKSSNTFRQNVPTSLQQSSSSQQCVAVPTCTQWDVQNERVLNVYKSGLHTVQSQKREMEEASGKKKVKISWRKGLGRSRKKSRLQLLSDCSKLKRSDINTIFGKSMLDEVKDQRMTRSQSISHLRLTRSVLAQSSLLKRSVLSSEQKLLDKSLHRQRKASQKRVKSVRTVKNKLIDESDFQVNRSSTTGTAQKRRGRPPHVRRCGHSNKQHIASSDGNNNLSKGSSLPKGNHLQLECGYPKLPGRLTRSALIRQASLGQWHKKSSNSTKNMDSNMVLLETSHSPQKLTVLGQSRKYLFSGDIAQADTKEKTQAFQSASLNNSTSADSMTSVQVRYGQHAVQNAAHCTAVNNMHGNDDSPEFDGNSKTGLSTDAGGLQSSTAAMTTRSEANDCCQEDNITTSSNTPSDVQCKESSCSTINSDKLVQNNTAAENEASSHNLRKARQMSAKPTRSREKGDHTGSSSLQNGSVDIPVCQQDQIPVDLASAEQSTTGSVLSVLWDSGPLSSISSFPGRSSSGSFFQKMSGFQTSSALSQLSILHTEAQEPVPVAQPGQVLQWNLQSHQRATVAYHPYTIGSVEPPEHPWFFKKWTPENCSGSSPFLSTQPEGGRKAKEYQSSVLLPQVCPVSLNMHDVQQVTQQCQVILNGVQPPLVTPPSTSVTGFCVQGNTGPDQIHSHQNQPDAVLSLQPYPAHTIPTPLSAVLSKPCEDAAFSVPCELQSVGVSLPQLYCAGPTTDISLPTQAISGPHSVTSLASVQDRSTALFSCQSGLTSESGSQQTRANFLQTSALSVGEAGPASNAVFISAPSDSAPVTGSHHIHGASRGQGLAVVPVCQPSSVWLGAPTVLCPNSVLGLPLQQQALNSFNTHV